MTVSQPCTVIDVAGAQQGGSLRYLLQLDSYLNDTHASHVRIIGRDRFITPQWLAQRELLAKQIGALQTISLNNQCFAAKRSAGSVVLLRNALHYLSEKEEAELGWRLDRRQRLVGLFSRSLARRSTRIIAPSAHMADRISSRMPTLRDRIEVLHHPLRAPTPGPRRGRFSILCPVINHPFKRLDLVLPSLIRGAEMSPEVDLRLTLSEEFVRDSYGSVPKGVTCLNRLSAGQVNTELSSADAVVYPTSIESFGYPLAEARLLGIPVLAYPIPLSEEIAGPSLVPCTFETAESVAEAIAEAQRLGNNPVEANPFNPERYFDRLLGLCGAPTTGH